MLRHIVFVCPGFTACLSGICCRLTSVPRILLLELLQPGSVLNPSKVHTEILQSQVEAPTYQLQLCVGASVNLTRPACLDDGSSRSKPCDKYTPPTPVLNQAQNGCEANQQSAMLPPRLTSFIQRLKSSLGFLIEVQIKPAPEGAQHGFSVRSALIFILIRQIKAAPKKC